MLSSISPLPQLYLLNLVLFYIYYTLFFHGKAVNRALPLKESSELKSNQGHHIRQHMEKNLRDSAGCQIEQRCYTHVSPNPPPQASIKHTLPIWCCIADGRGFLSIPVLSSYVIVDSEFSHMNQMP